MSETTHDLQRAEKAIIAGDVAELERILDAFRQQPDSKRWFCGAGPHVFRPEDAHTDARSILAREHCFERWTDFEIFFKAAREQGSAAWQFESAVEAAIAGDVSTLLRLLKENPGLVRERSLRRHHATLLHYLGANGVEGFRQRTPANAVEIMKILLEAGAEANAFATLYGERDTALGLVATSIHPLRAGVQDALMKTLLDHGAWIDREPGAAVNGCLANGRKRAAEFLASHGAPLNLEAAAGVGRLDLVRNYFDHGGQLQGGATEAERNSGFMWACEYGRDAVIDFLLRNGVDIGVMVNGMTGLHWAVIGQQPGTMRLLLERGAPLEVKNSYGGTILGQTLWCAIEGDPGYDHIPIIEMLLAAGAKIDPAWQTGVPRLDAILSQRPSS